MTDITFATHRREPAATTAKELTVLQSALIGGVGGIMPIIATLAGGEYETLVTMTVEDVNYVLGFGLRVVALFFLGAVLVWLHTDVRTRYAAFRLGVAGPAIVATMLSSTSANSADLVSSSAAGPPEVLVAMLDTGDGGSASDAIRPVVVFSGDCTVIDGLIGRKCK